MVETTLDLPLQAAAEQARAAGVAAAQGARACSRRALVALDGEGRVRAYVGGADYAAEPVRPRHRRPGARPARPSSPSSI